MIRNGIDLVDIERIARTINRQGARFLDRIFTKAEQAQCEGRIPSLAGRFAVKEAVAKAFGTGIGDMNWTDIEILQDERGCPHLHLHNRAQEVAASQHLGHWSVSLSHTDTHAVGLATALDMAAISIK
ncbi:MAG: holo-ACP synthase [Chloroflexota bacterium]